MEQYNIRIEQQELISQVKESHEESKLLLKLMAVLSIIFVLVVVGDVLTGGNLNDWIGSVFIFPLLTLLLFYKYRFYKAIKPVDDAHELLKHYKRYEMVSASVYSIMIICFLSFTIYNKYGYAAGITSVIICAVASLVCWLAGGFTDTNIKKLRKLVAQEEAKSETNV